MKTKTVGWFSAGVSSFVAIYLMRNEVDEVFYIDIDNQHPDTHRFLKDCEKALGKPIQYLKHSKFNSVEEVIEKFRYINGPAGAKCTGELKKKVRQDWEKEQTDVDLFRYIWGYDFNEKHRAERLTNNNPEYEHLFPLIDKELRKAEVHSILQQLGIARPIMYDLGYSNNNCIGCVKGGKGYWNKIRVDFPERFDLMARLERKIGASCINGTYLDELDPNAGRMEKEIMPDCGMLCELSFIEGGQ